MKKGLLKTYSIEAITDKYIGKPGSLKRETFEYQLRMDFLGAAIRQARMQRNLTQEELGRLIGVQRAQISKLENSLTDARVDTIVKVFKALKVRINFNLQFLNKKVKPIKGIAF